MAGKYVLKKSSQYYWSLKAGNGEIILSSEMYTTQQGALGGIDSCRANSKAAGNYEKSGSGEKWWFVLKAQNGQTIGRSEMYKSSSGRDNGIASCQENGPTGTLDDQT